MTKPFSKELLGEVLERESEDDLRRRTFFSGFKWGLLIASLGCLFIAWWTS